MCLESMVADLHIDIKRLMLGFPMQHCLIRQDKEGVLSDNLVHWEIEVARRVDQDRDFVIRSAPMRERFE